jgi:hypothetical protein
MILYKYCNQEGIRILDNLEIKVSPPNTFNDPFECFPTANARYPVDRLLKDLNNKKVLNEWRIQLKRDGLYAGSKTGFYQYISKNTNGILDFISEAHSGAQLFVCQGWCDFLSGLFGILCLSTEKLNQLLWAHYADSHKGIAIGIDFDKWKGEKAVLNRVNYSNLRPTIRSTFKNEEMVKSDLFARIAVTKPKVWEYEKEYRAFWNLDECLKKENTKGMPQYYHRINPEAISEVIIGLRANDNFTMRIKKALLVDHFRHVKLSKIETDSYSYELSNSLLNISREKCS